MKHSLLPLLLLLPIAAKGQNISPGNAANQYSQFLGGGSFNRALNVPAIDTAAVNTFQLMTPAIRRTGLTIWQDRLWYQSGGKWRTIPTVADIDTAVAGTVTSVTGVSTQDGTGAKVTFTIPHGLSAIPSYINVSANTSDAGGWRYVNADTTNLYIYYSVAPAAGTNNLRWSWVARP